MNGIKAFIIRNAAFDIRYFPGQAQGTVETILCLYACPYTPESRDIRVEMILYLYGSLRVSTDPLNP